MLPVRGRVLCGRSLAQAICQRIKAEVNRLIAEFNVSPKLTVIEVGNRSDSALYIESKRRFADQCGVELAHVHLPPGCTESSLIDLVRQFNTDPTVHGIMIQLPLDSTDPIDVSGPLHSIAAEKDVEGLGYMNTALLSRENVLFQPGVSTKDYPVHIPCTAAACFAFIRYVDFPLKGSHCVVIGRGRLVGAPTADLLAGPGCATVTQCNIHSQNLAEEVSRADLVVAAVGRPALVRGEWIKPGALVLDCGYTVVQDPSNPAKMISVGDVSFEEARKRAGWITPVPGGIGPLNIAMLFRNTVNSARWSVGLQSLSFDSIFTRSSKVHSEMDQYCLERPLSAS
ncbi:hypothetical protein CRM22_007551 [Opisthorchis felineus]|uniref:Methenyltetrahydrofolate cyclohydrolase n=2 Tax=Opisthorchis felineus TaxID=147828 RepID=A0A4S2LHF3_OPIFE|nr:hypothetical protein CRM22_007551 [Opisthorchis felineus]